MTAAAVEQKRRKKNTYNEKKYETVTQRIPQWAIGRDKFGVGSR